MLNLELGHIRIPHSRERDPFNGSCPFHGDCLEGLASGPAIEKRLGVKGSAVTDNDPFWNLEAEYIALALVDFIVTLSPRKIILGGGVMQQEFLFPKIRSRVCELLNGYVNSPSVLQNIDHYIVPPGLGNQSGSMGAIAMAMQLEESNSDPRL
jgi:fructokinase